MTYADGMQIVAPTSLTSREVKAYMKLVHTEQGVELGFQEAEDELMALVDIYCTLLQAKIDMKKNS